MTSTLTPPPLPPAAEPVGPRPNRDAARVITILVALLGAGVLVAVVWSGMRASMASAFAYTGTSSIEVDRVSDLDIEVGAADLTVRFDDVTEATLDVRNSTNGEWTLRHDGQTLLVHSPRVMWGSWFGNGNGRAILTLPAELEGSDARLSVGAGSLTADGAFGELDLGMGAGEMTVTGSADMLVADVSAGRADIDIDGVREADLQVSAGDLFARLGGSAPSEVRATVSAGSLQLTLPDDVYDVRSDVSAGGFDNGLRTASDASAQVFVEVAAGNARLLAD
ncbi:MULTISPECIES: hypothetical protein [Microbacterium]|uniref:Adhesin domain-containing protein n=1 Tax=Microbacterium wangchenii TaxID=2541726 RepID=A0ABX5SQE9_9MICO|nr:MULTISPECIES: hypothetical protein [Microbacterium]MCK6066422.1 DUF4097 domain-containing protein [Microbacterium sp. EYE_512]QBR87388.1 hypothetical protein E4K62_00920 [Microbacterium wangchenii]TFV84504.1 hypothetical protein E4V99_05480 [Microbacterium sp. dk485]TXK14710.1 DUF4097 domain-containing protein [Microbacterium wangchenii]